MRLTLAIALALSTAAAQDDNRRAEPLPTAVYTLADYHTNRRTNEQNPIGKIAGVCQIIPGQGVETLACTAPPVGTPRAGQRYYYSVVLFRDLNETLYMAACAATSRDTSCEDLHAGQTFPAEVEDQTLRIVIRDEQLPLRILEARPKPVTIDTPTKGTPSQVRPSTGTPSEVSWSKVAETRGAPSDVKPSAVSASAGAPSKTPPSEVSTPIVSPTGARLNVYTSVNSANVFVDGQLVGTGPLEVPIVPGRHTVRVQAQGFQEWSRTVTVPAGGTTRITADLRR